MKRALLGIVAAGGLLVGLGAPVTASAAPDQKIVVTYDCGSAGTFQAEGLNNSANALQILNSDQYHAMVGHEYWVNGQFYYQNAANGNEGPLYTCTTHLGSYVIVALMQLV